MLKFLAQFLRLSFVLKTHWRLFLSSTFALLLCRILPESVWALFVWEKVHFWKQYALNPFILRRLTSFLRCLVSFESLRLLCISLQLTNFKTLNRHQFLLWLSCSIFLLEEVRCGFLLSLSRAQFSLSFSNFGLHNSANANLHPEPPLSISSKESFEESCEVKDQLPFPIPKQFQSSTYFN